MLKIKDNVDLKELEKFGFEYVGNVNTAYIKKNGALTIYVSIDRQITGYGFYAVGDRIVSDNIQDLIQAGLVEKVEEK